jgi:hypothetical protein
MNPISQSLQANPTHELAQAIYRLYSCDKQEERQSILEAFRTLGKYFLSPILILEPGWKCVYPLLEKNPEAHIRNVITVLTDSTLDEVSLDLKMSAGVYLKNYTGTILKTIMSSNQDAEGSKYVARN